MDRNIGTWLVIAGLVMAGIGALAMTGALRWFGRLPGDIRAEGEHTSFFFPITSMVLVSVVLTIIVNLVGRGR